MANSPSFCRVSPEHTWRFLLQTANLLAILKSPFWCLSNVTVCDCLMYCHVHYTVTLTRFKYYECNNIAPISIVLHCTLNSYTSKCRT